MRKKEYGAGVSDQGFREVFNRTYSRARVAKLLGVTRSGVRSIVNRGLLHPTLVELPGRGERWRFPKEEADALQKTYKPVVRKKKGRDPTPPFTYMKQRAIIMAALKRGIRNVGELVRLSHGASEKIILQCLETESLSVDELARRARVRADEEAAEKLRKETEADDARRKRRMRRTA